MQPFSIQRIRNNDPSYPRVFALRDEVLRKPIGLSLADEDLSDEAGEEIVIALEDERVIGCVMLKEISGSIWKLRQMAVDKDFQGKGVGAALVAEAERFAMEKAISKIELHARLLAVPFYEKCGYSVMGDVFTEVGIPHLFMIKLLA